MSEDTEEFLQARYCLLGCGVSLVFDQGLGSVYVMMGEKEIRTQERTQEQWYIQCSNSPKWAVVLPQHPRD